MRPSSTAIVKLALLRWASMVGYSATYVVIPALIFHGTRSALLAGAAFLAEGLIRAAISVFCLRFYASQGSRRAVVIAEACRVVGIVAVGFAVKSFSLPLVVAASILFQFGYSLISLEQELRCTELGPDAVRGQTAFRLSEVFAMCAVLAVSMAPLRHEALLLALLVTGVLGVALHMALSLSWYRADYAHARFVGDTRLRDAARLIVAEPMLWRGLGVCVVAFTVFVWALSGGPFLLEGRTLFGHGMDEASGIAAFKLILAIAGGTGAITWGWLLTRPAGPRAAIVCAVAAPTFLALSVVVAEDWIAVGLLALMMGAAVGTLSWQRAYRQAAAPPALRMGMTALFLAADCLGMALAGIALMLGAPLPTALLLAVVCFGLSSRAWRESARPTVVAGR